MSSQRYEALTPVTKTKWGKQGCDFSDCTTKKNRGEYRGGNVGDKYAEILSEMIPNDYNMVTKYAFNTGSVA